MLTHNVCVFASLGVGVGSSSVSSSLLLNSAEVGVAACLTQLGRCILTWPANSELTVCLAWLVSLPSLASSRHTRVPKATAAKYQLSLLDGSRNVVMMDAVLQ